MQKMFHVLISVIVFFSGSLYGMELEGKSKVSKQEAAWKTMSFRDKILYHIQAGTQNSQGMFGVTLLFAACQRDNLECIRLLLDAQADVNLPTYADCIPLHVVAEVGNIEAAKLLLAAGSHVDWKNCREHTPLQIAQKFGHTEIAELLVEQMEDEKMEWRKVKLAKRRTW